MRYATFSLLRRERVRRQARKCGSLRRALAERRERDLQIKREKSRIDRGGKDRRH